MTKIGSIVSLVRASRSEDVIKGSVRRALDLIDFEMKNPIRTVTIKVNLCYYWDAVAGHTTDLPLVAGIIDYVRERWRGDIDIKVVEADATAMRTKYAFAILGYDKLAKEKNVELFNLSNDALDEKEVQVNGRTIRFKIPVSLMKSDLFISVPKLKIHSLTRVTCALKNIFGCIASRRKVVYHPFLNEAIVGVNKILHPHLTIVDGLVALGRFPAKLGLIMASVDPFSIDWIVSQIMGYNPSKIGFLKVALKEKLGDPNGILTLGESVNTFRKVFPKQNFVYSKLSLKTQKTLLTLYEKIVGDVVPSEYKTK